MCGIVAVAMAGGRPVDRERLVAMRDTLVHRGPDGAGVHVDGPVGLGHRRLSIIDLSAAGHQPMCNEDETVWLTFNGEIYNYVELAAELRQRGHRFRSHTDSEVIIHLWEELGERCVDRLNGIFAFVIWDRRRQELFCARDRAGVKPLQYYQGPDRFIAASEIKAILADPAVPRRPDNQGLADYVMTGYPLGDKTCFQGIRQLLPGWALSWRNGEVRTWEYWDLRFNPDRSRSLDETTEALASLMDDAITLQCRSDAPLGCHLSGGLDSTTVAALTARHYSPLRTFSIRFEGGPQFDETPAARSVAGLIGAQHHEATPGPMDLAGLLGALTWHADMPMPDISSFSYFTVARLAAGHVTVALTGHGGDEIFAGYPAQFQAAFGDTSMFEKGPEDVHSVPFSTKLRLALRRYGLSGALGRALRRNVAPDSGDLASLWPQLHCGPSPLHNHALLKSFRHSLGGYDSRIEYVAPLLRPETDDVLDRCLYHDLRSYLPRLLHQEDRASMMMSIESRVPCLDHRIVEFMATVPTEQKVVGRRPKALLRRVALGLLPEAVVDQRRKGAFPVPARSWFNRELAPLVRGIVLSRSARERGIFDPVELRSGWHGAGGLWAALSLELWFRVFIDQDLSWLEGAPRTRGPRTPQA